MIENITDLLEEIGVDNEESASKAIYKGTECGANIQFFDDGVILGSIIEGSDVEITRPKLEYPFTSEEFWDTLDEINDEACYEAEILNEERKIADGDDDIDLDDLDDLFN